MGEVGGGGWVDGGQGEGKGKRWGKDMWEVRGVLRREGRVKGRLRRRRRWVGGGEGTG